MNRASIQLVGGSAALAEEIVRVPERCSAGLVAGTWQALGTAMDAVRRADVVVLFPVRGIYDPFAGNNAGPPVWATGDSWMAPLPKHAVAPEDELASDDDNQDESPPISREVFWIYMQRAARELLSPTVAGQVIVVFSPIRPGEHRREYDLFRWWLQLPLGVEPDAGTTRVHDELAAAVREAPCWPTVVAPPVWFSDRWRCRCLTEHGTPPCHPAQDSWQERICAPHDGSLRAIIYHRLKARQEIVLLPFGTDDQVLDMLAPLLRGLPAAGVTREECVRWKAQFAQLPRPPRTAQPAGQRDASRGQGRPSAAPKGGGHVFREWSSCHPPPRSGPVAPTFLGESPGLYPLFRNLVGIGASSSGHVLLTGETGTGKELVASLVHQQWFGAETPLVPLNCAGLPPTLADSLLFGHVQGSFTGADADRPGLVMQARGSLFLDELQALPAEVAPKLLRFLEDGSFVPVGWWGEPLRAQVRIIAATNDPTILNESALHRMGLIARFTYRIALPPLRRRWEDLPALIQHFVAEVKAAEQVSNWPPPTVVADWQPDDARLQAWRRRDWRNENVRGLRSAVRGWFSDQVAQYRLAHPPPGDGAVPGGGAGPTDQAEVRSPGGAAAGPDPASGTRSRRGPKGPQMTDSALLAALETAANDESLDRDRLKRYLTTNGHVQYLSERDDSLAALKGRIGRMTDEAKRTKALELRQAILGKLKSTVGTARSKHQ